MLSPGGNLSAAQRGAAPREGPASAGPAELPFFEPGCSCPRIQPAFNCSGKETGEGKHNKNAAKNFSKCFFERICRQPRSAGSAADSYARRFFPSFDFLKILLVPFKI